MQPQFPQATIYIEDVDDSIMQGLPAEWVHSEEWYSFDKSPRAAGVHILATVDEKTYAPKKNIRMGDDHPLICNHCMGKGRVFYSALGHQASAYAENARSHGPQILMERNASRDQKYIETREL